MTLERVSSAAEAGAELRSRRKALGMTQGQLAEAMGCSQRLVSELERGRGTVGFDKVMRAFSEVGLRVMVEPVGEPSARMSKWTMRHARHRNVD